jgi:hypothetical protein
MTREDIAQTLRAQFREDVIREQVASSLCRISPLPGRRAVQINVRISCARAPESEEADEGNA